MKKYIIIFIILFPLSKFVFNELQDSLLLLKNNKSITNDKVVKIGDDVMLYNKLLTECFEKYNYDVLIDCEQKIKESQKDKVQKKEKKNNYMIETIYLLMVLALNIQLSIFIYVFIEKNKINQIYFHLSDWAINSPPMLGVLGTIVSFAILVGEMENGNIQEIFSEKFFDAAITTIIGGLIYVFNMFLKVKIYTRLK